MTAQTGTLTSRQRMSPTAWITLLVAALVAVALAVGGYALVDRSTTSAPAPAPATVSTRTIEGVTQVPGLIKGGLQPRPFSPIEVPAEAPARIAVPEGFVRIGTSDDFRPVPGA
jgi:hypothetical protein